MQFGAVIVDVSAAEDKIDKSKLRNLGVFSGTRLMPAKMTILHAASFLNMFYSA